MDDHLPRIDTAWVGDLPIASAGGGVKLLPAASRVAEPWRNGGGRTATVERDAHWRVSIAEVSDASAFSRFPGMSRLLMPLSEPGVVLDINGGRRALRALQAGGFDGEDAVSAVGVSRPTEVLNLMWHSALCAAELRTIACAGILDLTADSVLLAIVVAGRLTLAGGEDLSRLDAVRIEPGEAAIVSGSGQLALARVRDRSASEPA